MINLNQIQTKGNQEISKKKDDEDTISTTIKNKYNSNLNNQEKNLNSLNILSELASSVQFQPNQIENQVEIQNQIEIENQNQIHTLSDETFHALLLASLSHQSKSIQIQNQINLASNPSTKNLLNQIEIQSNQNYAKFNSSDFQINQISVTSNKLSLNQKSKKNLTKTTTTPTTTTTTTTPPLHSINNLNQQNKLNDHAQDLLSALSALQSNNSNGIHDTNQTTTDSIIDQDHFEHQIRHPHHSQEELDFDDPNLFSPFEPESDQMNSNQDNNLLSAEIDFLLGTHSFNPMPSIPSTSTTHSNKIYSNSFASLHHQDQMQQNFQLNQIHSNQLEIFNPSTFPSHLENHQDLNFLFEDQHQDSNSQHGIEKTTNQKNSSEKQKGEEEENQLEFNQTQELLDRLDYGIKMNQDQIKLQNLDSLIESSLNFNQIYLNFIKKTLDNLTSKQQEANQFLSTSKKCLSQIQMKERQKQRKMQNESSSYIGTSTSKPSTSSSNKNNNSSTQESCINLNCHNEKDSILVSNQICSVSLPWFKHRFGADLPLFEDGKRRDQYNSLLHQQPWQPSERRKLDEEVTLQLNSNQNNKSLIDWGAIARIFPERKPIECKIQWTQKQDPSINKSKWTSIEIDRLFEIVKKFDSQNWRLIANELGTGRTPADCVKQFRSVTQEKREWTESDDHLLKEGVSTYGQNWQAVAKHCGRSSNQCINRWSKTLRPDIKKGKWDPIEDEALRNAVAAVGMVWKDVAPRVRGRTDAQCRERWCNILDPRIVVGNWSKEEDERILRMRDLESKTWSEISKSFDGRRTDNHCMRRHSELKRVKESKSNRKSSTQQTQVGDMKTRSVTQVTNAQDSNTNLTSIPIHRNTLGRVLIPTDDGFSARRIKNTVSSIALPPSSSSPSDSNLNQIFPSENHVVTSSDHHQTITSNASSNTKTIQTYSNLNADTDNRPKEGSNVNINQDSNLNLRNLNSRLRSSNKRLKYSS